MFGGRILFSFLLKCLGTLCGEKLLLKTRTGSKDIDLTMFGGDNLGFKPGQTIKLALVL